MLAFADLSCQGGLVRPARSKASSVKEGFKHRFAWDEQSSWNYIEDYSYADNDYGNGYDYIYTPSYLMTVGPSVCNFGKQMKNIKDFPNSLQSFFGYYCDMEKVYKYGYDDYLNNHLGHVCNFELALENGFFTSDLFDGTLYSFTTNFCLGMVNNYDYLDTVAWDEQSSRNYIEYYRYTDNNYGNVYDNYYSVSTLDVMTMGPSGCDFGKQMKNMKDYLNSFQSFFGYYCDMEKVYKYDKGEYLNLEERCNFELALESDFFTSDLFDGTFYSFETNFCPSVVNHYDYLDTGPFATKVEARPWLLLEFERDILVTKVFVTTRSDCCAHSFTRITVSVGIKGMTKSEKGELSQNPLCARYDGPPSFLGEIVTITCNNPLIGIFVVIQQNNPLDRPKEIAMQEVEICGEYL